MRRDYIEEALLNAEKSILKVANHGAIVVFRGKIVGHGYNKYCVKNEKINKWSIHAEVDAINNALRKISLENLRKSTLIVVRRMKENKNNESNGNGNGSNGNDGNENLNTSSNGVNYCYECDNENYLENEHKINYNFCDEIGLSEPCKNCNNYIKKFGIRTCFYSV